MQFRALLFLIYLSVASVLNRSDESCFLILISVVVYPLFRRPSSGSCRVVYFYVGGGRCFAGFSSAQTERWMKVRFLFFEPRGWECWWARGHVNSKMYRGKTLLFAFQTPSFVLPFAPLDMSDCWSLCFTFGRLNAKMLSCPPTQKQFHITPMPAELSEVAMTTVIVKYPFWGYSTFLFATGWSSTLYCKLPMLFFKK